MSEEDFDFAGFRRHIPPNKPVFNVEVVPKEMDIFFLSEDDFLPDGKTFAELTDVEDKKLRSQYRFSPFRPGLYQTLTGFGNMC